jgi:1-acyl-sn-glycerol-3-phosphate acyltransferase
MSHAGYFKLLKLYSDIWARRHCHVVLSGEEHVRSAPKENRVYLICHPTTWDLPLLVHFARNNFSAVVAAGPFTHPLVNWLFRNAGFIKLEQGKTEEMISQATAVVAAGSPLLVALKRYGEEAGDEARPRTGGIRIAYQARADLYPVHLMIEEGKMITKGFKDRSGAINPFTVFHDTLYFATFCRPLRYSDYAREGMGYEDFQAVANSVEATFNETGRRIQAELKAGRYDGLPRRGGVRTQVIY